MSPETLARELQREPFIPLRVHLIDGSHFDVINPGVSFVARLALYVFETKRGESLAKDVRMVGLLQIASVESMTPL